MPRFLPLFVAITMALASPALASPQPDSLDLAPYAGKVVMVDFWASWCGPCLQSFPWMKKVQRLYSEQGFQVIAVNEDHNSGKAKAFLKKHHPTGLEIVFDPEGQIAENYNLEGMPCTYLYDRQGKLVSSHVGFEPDHSVKYEKAIQDLLAEPYSKPAPTTPEATHED